MNIENITTLRDFLLTLDPDMFDMRSWCTYRGLNWASSRVLYGEKAIKEALLHTCGTCACIGGWTEVLFNKNGAMNNEALAAEHLGLDDLQSHSLFYPLGVKNLSEITPVVAAETLTKLMATGVVDWSHVSGDES